MPRLVSIQVLRAVAALMVAVHHALHDAGALAQSLGRAFAAPTALPWQAGVDIFFVISGFVMVHASQGLFGAPGAPRTFLARRVARVVPLYWLVTTLYLALALAAPGALNSESLDPLFVAASYAFWPMSRPDGLVQPLYSLGWTLNYEMMFYALFALAVPFARDRAVPGLIAVLVGLVAAGRALAPPQPLAFWTDPIILEFALGMGLGLAHARGLRLPDAARLALAVLGVAALGALGTLAPDLPRAAAFGVPAALLVAAAGLVEGRRQASAWSRWGERLGDASYALYLLHPFAIRGTRIALGVTGLGALVGPWGFVLLALAGALAASLVVYQVVERPLTRAARRRLGA